MVKQIFKIGDIVELNWKSDQHYHYIVRITDKNSNASSLYSPEIFYTYKPLIIFTKLYRHHNDISHFSSNSLMMEGANRVHLTDKQIEILKLLYETK